MVWNNRSYFRWTSFEKCDLLKGQYNTWLLSTDSTFTWDLENWRPSAGLHNIKHFAFCDLKEKYTGTPSRWTMQWMASTLRQKTTCCGFIFTCEAAPTCAATQFPGYSLGDSPTSHSATSSALFNITRYGNNGSWSPKDSSNINSETCFFSLYLQFVP